MFGFQAADSKVAVAHFLQLVGYQVEDALAVGARGMAAITIACA